MQNTKKYFRNLNSQWVCVNRHTVDSLFGQRSIGLGIDGEFFELIDCIESIDNPTEQSVLQVQMGLGSIRDEELAGIRVRTTVRHRQHATICVPQIVLEFILEFAIPYRSASFAGSSWVAGLHNEALDVAMEQVIVVVITGAKGQEVFAGLRAVVAKQLEFDVSDVRVKGNRLPGDILYINFIY